MTLRFCALASGSRGNALLVEHEDTLVMIDCGLPLKNLRQRLRAAGRTPEDIDAVLVTHEHQDHSRGIRPLTHRYEVPVYATHGTAQAVAAIDCYEPLRFDREVTIGSLGITSFPVPHDAREPCHFVVRGGERRLGLLTDSGHATPAVRDALRACDALGVEFNHDLGLLEAGRYPPAVKARVASRFGHLSNAQAGELLGELVHDGLQWVTALHLSERNNRPDRVREAIAPAANRHGFAFHCAAQDDAGDWIELEGC